MHKLLIATHNKGKLALIKEALHLKNFDIVSLTDIGITYDVPETGSSYEENATLKAVTYAKLSGMLTLAEDGGIEIDALNGAPGIYSARFAGENKTDKQKVDYILDLLKNVPPEKRQAHFYSVIVLVEPNGNTHCFGGVMHGTLALESRGTPFIHLPYRQIFIPDGYHYTLDQLSDQNITYDTHRTQALKSVTQFLQQNYE